MSVLTFILCLSRKIRGSFGGDHGFITLAELGLVFSPLFDSDPLLFSIVPREILSVIQPITIDIMLNNTGLLLNNGLKTLHVNKVLQLPESWSRPVKKGRQTMTF